MGLLNHSIASKPLIIFVEGIILKVYSRDVFVGVIWMAETARWGMDGRTAGYVSRTLTQESEKRAMSVRDLSYDTTILPSVSGVCGCVHDGVFQVELSCEVGYRVCLACVGACVFQAELSCEVGLVR